MQGFQQPSQNQKYGNYSYEAFQIIDQQRQRLEQKIIKEERLKEQTQSLAPQQESVERFNHQHQLPHSLYNRTTQDQSQTYNFDPNQQENDSYMLNGDESQIQKLIHQYQQQWTGGDNQENEQFDYQENEEYEQDEDYDKECNDDQENYEQQEEDDSQYQNDEDYNNFVQSQEQDQAFDSRFTVNAISGFQAQVSMNKQTNEIKITKDQPIKQYSQPKQQLELHQRQDFKGMQEDCDNDFLIKMKIQEQMKKYDQSKQCRLSEDEQEKNRVKQQVWEQLFNKKQNTVPTSATLQLSSATQKPTKAKDYPQSRQLQQKSQHQNQNQINNIDQTTSNIQNSTINPSMTNQYINNFLINQNAIPLNVQPKTTEYDLTNKSKILSSQLRDNKLKQQQLIQEENFQDKFQSQLFQIPSKVLYNEIPIQYLDQESQDSDSSFGKSKGNSVHINQSVNSQIQVSNKQERINQSKDTENQKQKSFHDVEKQDFSLTQKSQDNIFGNMKPLVQNDDKFDQEEEDDDDDMDDLNSRQSELFMEESYRTRLNSNGNKALQLIQEVEESQFRQTGQNQVDQEDDSEPQNKFIQFDIGLENEQNVKFKNFELLKKKKLDDLERAKLERQRKKTFDEENELEVPTPKNRNQTPTKRDRSPLMPSAQGRGKKNDECEQSQNKNDNSKKLTSNDPTQMQKQLEKGNIFSDNFTFNDNKPSPLPPKQNKAVIQEQGSYSKQIPRRELIVQDQPISGKEDRPISGKDGRSRNNSTNKMSNNRLDTSSNTINSALLGKAKKNNRLMLKNAIMNVCLAGDPNKKEREAIIAQLESVEADHFIILLKGQFGRMDFKALYGMNSQDQTPELLFQAYKSPPILDPAQVLTYLKYDSGAKEFKPISGNKTFSYIVDAVKLKK